MSVTKSAKSWRSTSKKLRKQVVIIDPPAVFTHNVARAIQDLGVAATIVEERRFTIKAVEQLRPTHIILCPALGDPYKSPLLEQVLARFGSDMPILGTTVGMLVIALYFGAKLIPCKNPGNSQTEALIHNKRSEILKGIPSPFNVVYYRRLTVDPKSMKSDTLVAQGRNRWGEKLVIKGEKLPHIIGLAFQPDSYSTEHGEQIFANFLSL